jgi:hypothetical protein
MPRQGRRYVHQRDTDDAAIIGEDVEVHDAHQAAVRDTLENASKLDTKRNHRCEKSTSL